MNINKGILTFNCSEAAAETTSEEQLQFMTIECFCLARIFRSDETNVWFNNGVDN